MTTAIESSIFVAFWDTNDALNSLAQSALNAAWNRGSLVVAPPVYAELLAFAGHTEGFLDSFLKETGITVDWEMDETIWRTAGRVFQRYAARRRRHSGSGPRRIPADFLIGTHCAEAFASSLSTPACTKPPSHVSPSSRSEGFSPTRFADEKATTPS
jgi:predicted nucleic acid-binding protein